MLTVWISRHQKAVLPDGKYYTAVVDEGRDVTLRTVKDQEYILDELWARVDQLCDTTHPIRDIEICHIAELTVAI